MMRQRLPWAQVILAAGLAGGASLLLALGEFPMAGVLVASVLFVRLLLSGAWPITMVWLIGMPTVFVFLNGVLAGVPFLKAERAAFALAGGAVLVRALFKRADPLPFNGVEKAIWGLLALFTASMLMGMRGKDLADFVKFDVSYLVDGFATSFLAYMIVRRCEWTEARVKAFLLMLSLVGVFLTVTAVLQLYAGVSAFEPEYAAVMHRREDRATGVFTGAVEFGAVAATCLLVAGALRYSTSSSFSRGALAAVMVAVMAAVLLSKTRGVWVGLLASLVFLYAHDSRGRPLMNMLTITAVLAGVAVLPLVLDVDKLSQRVTDPVPIYNRLAAWAAAVNMSLQNPLGVGLSRNGFGDAKDAYFVTFGPVSSLWAADVNVPHNEFLNILALTGVAGLALYLTVLVRMYKLLLGIWRRSALPLPVRTLALYAAAALVGVTVNGFFVDISKFNYLYTLLFALAGVASVAPVLWSAPDTPASPPDRAVRAQGR
jgi:O-antigen ligase